MTKKAVGFAVATVIAVSVFSAVALKREGNAARSTTDFGATSAEDAAAGAKQAPQSARGAPYRGTGRGMAAIESAAQAGKYLFVFFYKNEDEQTRVMRDIFDSTMHNVAHKAESVAINTADPLERAMVAKFNVNRAPLPFALALAPNGAITGGFPVEFDQEQLMGAFSSPSMEKCLKALQERRLVFLSVQNTTTELNDEAMQGVRDFKADARFAQATEIITVDPSDAAEAKLLRQLKVDPNTHEAITVFLAPPGTAIGMFKGATNKSTLVATVQKAASGCGSGCGPKGCKPPKKGKG